MRNRRKIAVMLAVVITIMTLPYNVLPVYAIENIVNEEAVLTEESVVDEQELLYTSEDILMYEQEVLDSNELLEEGDSSKDIEEEISTDNYERLINEENNTYNDPASNNIEYKYYKPYSDATYSLRYFIQQDGTICIDGLKGTDSGRLIIPGSIDGNTVTIIGANAFEECMGFTGSFEIPYGVTKIGDHAFSGCDGITGDLLIPSSVKTIGACAFCWCLNLGENLRIPDSVTTIDETAFYECGKIKKVINESPVTVELSWLSNALGETWRSYDTGKVITSIANGIAVREDYKESLNDDEIEMLATYAGIAAEKCDTDSGISSFALHDLNSDGVPELIIDIDGLIVSGDDNLYYTYRNSEAVLLDSTEAQYPVHGCLSSSPQTGTFCFKRGGPAFIDDEIGKDINPWTYIQYAIEGNKIVKKTEAWANYYCNANGTDTYAEGYINGKKVSEEEFNTFKSQFSSAVSFIYNTSENRDKYLLDSGNWYANISANSFSVHKNGKTVPLEIKWSFKDFKDSAFNYNHRLAIAGLALSAAANNSKDGDYSPIKDMLTRLGFDTDKPYHKNYKAGTYTNNPGISIASKKITVDGKEKIIIAVVIRGTTAGTSDLKTDLNAIVNGYNKAGKYAKDCLKEYIEKYYGKSLDLNNTILFITGHSLGAATASVLAQNVNDIANKSDTYVYTYASPNYDITDTYYENDNQLFNIHSIINVDDSVPKMIVTKDRLTNRIITKIDTTGIHITKIDKDKNYNRLNESSKFDTIYKELTGSEYSYNELMNARDIWNYVIYADAYNGLAVFDNNTSAAISHAVETYMSFLLAHAPTDSVSSRMMRLLLVECPVDITIRDGDGQLCGQVINNEVIYPKHTDIIIMTDGDKKYILMPYGSNYDISMTGTDTGLMKYTILDTDISVNETIDEVVYENVSLETGKQFVGEVSDEIKDLFVINKDNELIREVEKDGTEVDIEDNSNVEVVKVLLDPVEQKMKVSDVLAIKTSILPKYATDKKLTWSTNNPAVATVSDAGVVTAVGVGTTTITAKSTNGKTATATIIVTDKAEPAPTPTDWGDIEGLPDVRKMFKNIKEVPKGCWYAFAGDDTVYKPSTSPQAIKVNKDYTGRNIMFNNEVMVFYGTERLLEGRDYKVKYINNIAAAPASDQGSSPAVIIKGMGGCYKGSEDFRFTISDEQPVKIDADVKIAGLNTKPEYTGNVLTLDDLYTSSDKSGYSKVTLYTEKDGVKTELTEGQDYSFDDTQLRKEGSFTLMFELTGKYEGSVISAPITVQPYNVKNHIKAADSKVVISIEENPVFKKSGAEPKVTVKFDGTDLKQGVDYNVSYSGNKKFGQKGKVRINFVGYFTGSVKEFFETGKKDVSLLTVSTSDKKYKESPGNFKILPSIVDGDKAVSKSKDIEKFKMDNGCEYFYADGEKKGEKIADDAVVPSNTLIEVRVNVKSRENGPYTGEAKLSGYYRLIGAEKNIKKAVLSKKFSIYTKIGDEIIPVYGKDYTLTMPGATEPLKEEDFEIVSITKNRFIGTATVTVRGKNGYGGTKRFTFKVIKRQM